MVKFKLFQLLLCMCYVVTSDCLDSKTNEFHEIMPLNMNNNNSDQ